MGIPCDHFTNFPPKWWTARRRRDYFIDADNCVRLRPGSKTAIKVCSVLRKKALELVQK